MTPQALTLDERAVLCRQPGTFLPLRSWRAQTRLIREGVLVDTKRVYRHAVPVFTLQLTPEGTQLRAQLLQGVQDPEHGWGILHVDSGGEDCWWRPNGAGYSVDLAGAGLYKRENAHAINGRGRMVPGRDMVLPPARMLELVNAEIDKANARMEKLLALRAELEACT